MRQRQVMVGALALVMPVVLSLGVCSTGDGDLPVHGSGSAEVRITNNSDTTICYVYIDSSADMFWGEDRLGTDVIVEGDTHTFKLDPGEYDMRAEDCSEDAIQERYNVVVSESYHWQVSGP